jgi:hypothetical protein
LLSLLFQQRRFLQQREQAARLDCEARSFRIAAAATLIESPAADVHRI